MLYFLFFAYVSSLKLCDFGFTYISSALGGGKSVLITVTVSEFIRFSYSTVAYTHMRAHTPHLSAVSEGLTNHKAT